MKRQRYYKACKTCKKITSWPERIELALEIILYVFEHRVAYGRPDAAQDLTWYTAHLERLQLLSPANRTSVRRPHQNANLR